MSLPEFDLRIGSNKFEGPESSLINPGGRTEIP